MNEQTRKVNDERRAANHAARAATATKARKAVAELSDKEIDKRLSAVFKQRDALSAEKTTLVAAKAQRAIHAHLREQVAHLPPDDVLRIAVEKNIGAAAA